jgi:predicted ester cyclase
MEETLQKEKLNATQKAMLDYFNTHDVKYVAEDAVFKNLNTGETYKGKADISAMLHYMYHVAFNAKPEVINFIITDDKALLEGNFRGKHIGDFAGIAATNREVNVPISVSYDLKDGLIREARIYMLADVLSQQLGVSGQGFSQKTSFVVRDIFRLKFGHFREAKELLKEAMDKNMMPPESKNNRVLTDFTGESYRLIFEEGYDHLGDYEISLNSSMHTEEWQNWYERFKPHVESSHREILRQVI